MKKLIVFFLMLGLVFSLTGCAESEYDIQFKEPKSGDVIGIIHTNMGDVTVKFFSNEAPKAVENFVILAERGYYNGVTFHRVIEDFMVQSGDPTGTGMGGESYDGEPFENEIVSYLSTYRGALCMANAGEDNTNTSQFFIVTDADTDVSRVESANDMVDKEYRVSEEKLKRFQEHGGALWLDAEISRALNLAYGSTVNAHTVFGQVIDGMDVVDQISHVDVYSELEAKEANIDEPGQTEILENKPKEDVVIESIEITRYEK